MAGNGKTDDDGAPTGDAPIRLSLMEVYLLAYAAAVARGLPDRIPDAVGQRVLWLEARGLPGTIALAREFLNNRSTDPRDRGRDCPLIAGAMMIDQFPALVSDDPSRPHAIDGPSNGVLILPLVAHYSATIGEPVRVSWLMGDPPEIKAQTVVDGDRVITVGELPALLFNTGVAFARHGEPLEEGLGASVQEAVVPNDVFEPYLSFIGRPRIDMLFQVRHALTEVPEIVEGLRSLSAGDRSTLETAATLSNDSPVSLITTQGSGNDVLWSRICDFGWLTRSESEGAGPQGSIVRTYVMTDLGRAALPMLLHAFDRFKPAAH